MWIVICACTQASWQLQQQPECPMPVSGVRADSHSSRPSLELFLAALLIFSPHTPGNKEARKSLLPLWQFQTFSLTPSQLAVAHLAPFGLCSRSQPQSSPLGLTSEARASAPSPRPPRRLSRQASRAGECCSAPSLCARISPLCPPHPCGYALLRGSKASPLCRLQSPPAKGLPSVWKPFLLHSSLPLVQVPSLFFCLCFFFFLLPFPGTWGVSCLLGGLRSSVSVQ